MNFNNFTIKSQEAVQRAQQIAIGNETQTIELGHILKGAFEIDQNVIPKRSYFEAYRFTALNTDILICAII